jgi:hypothetical protein
MFTETPPSGRRVRGKPPGARQSMGPPQLQPQLPIQQQQQSQQHLGPRKSSATGDHPATPLASVGPPNFSYGSATHALPRQISLADTKMSMFAAMTKAAKDAHERDVRAGKAVPEPEGQSPLVRFYEESLDEMPTGSISPPKIRPLRDEPVLRNSPRRSTRNTRSVNRSQSVESDMRRTPTPTPSEGIILLGCRVDCRIRGRETDYARVGKAKYVTYETNESCKDTKGSGEGGESGDYYGFE